MPAATHHSPGLQLRFETFRLRCRLALGRLKRSLKAWAFPMKREGKGSLQAAGMEHIDESRLDLDPAQFLACIHVSDTYRQGPPGRIRYIDDSSPRLYRILANMIRSRIPFQGPTLDVASGSGLLYPCLRRYLPELLPYSIAEMAKADLTIDGETIPCGLFECDKDRLPFEDRSFGTLLFCDCLEHLIVDPVWTILEFNRVLRPGGHLIISTPNAASIARVAAILEGQSPATENAIKPTAIYQRHNREWTLSEVAQLLSGRGFIPRGFSTSSSVMTRAETDLLALLRQHGKTTEDVEVFGPDLFVVAEKVAEKTLDSELAEEEALAVMALLPARVLSSAPDDLSHRRIPRLLLSSIRRRVQDVGLHGFTTYGFRNRKVVEELIGQVPDPTDRRRDHGDSRAATAVRSSFAFFFPIALLVGLEQHAFHSDRFLDPAVDRPEPGRELSGYLAKRLIRGTVVPLLPRVEKPDGFRQVQPKECTDFRNLPGVELFEEDGHREGENPDEVGPELYHRCPSQREADTVPAPQIGSGNQRRDGISKGEHILRFEEPCLEERHECLRITLADVIV